MPIPGQSDKPKIITFTGDLGSGKSTISKKLAALWQVKHYSGGDLMRKAAAEENVSITDINKTPLKAEWLDSQIDGMLSRMGEYGDDLVVDSRLGWFFIENSFKVKFTIDSSIAARRLMAGGKREGESYSSPEEAAARLQERQAIERQRFREKYDADIDSTESFDLIIDTSFAQLQDILPVVIRCAEKHFSGQPYPKNWLSPQLLIPMEDIRKVGRAYCDELRDKIAKEGFDDNEPIDIISYKKAFFLENGHHRAFNALALNIPLIPTNLIQSDQAMESGKIMAWEHVAMSFNPGFFYDWQDAVNACRRDLGAAPIDWGPASAKLPGLVFPHVKRRHSPRV